MTLATSLIAHQGGWDEILLVAGPILVIVTLLAIVKKRIDAHVASTTDASTVSTAETSHGVGSDTLDRGTDSP